MFYNMIISCVNNKWHGQHHTLVADMAEDIRNVCKFSKVIYHSSPKTSTMPAVSLWLKVEILASSKCSKSAEW